MQRFINKADQVVEDSIRGFVKAHKDLVTQNENQRVIQFIDAPLINKVGIVTGGGSGHEPAFLGYIGKNLLDAVAIGEIFSSPTARSFADAFKAADSGKGVACLYGNYAGDNMNVKMAIKMVSNDGVMVKTVVANDDVASASKSEKEKRRGVAGEILMWKVGAASAARGDELDEVIRLSQKAIDNTLSIGIGLTSCIIPDVGHANFHIEAGTMEVGIGHHGEPGVSIESLCDADEVAEKMLEQIYKDQLFKRNDNVVVLLSGLGATPINELYIIYQKVEALLEEQGITIYRNYIGNLFTSLDMMGVTLTLMRIDEELKPLIDLSVNSVGLKQF